MNSSFLLWTSVIIMTALLLQSIATIWHKTLTVGSSDGMNDNFAQQIRIVD